MPVECSCRMFLRPDLTFLCANPAAFDAASAASASAAVTSPPAGIVELPMATQLFPSINKAAFKTHEYA
jgi:hypothetical protein